MFSGILVQWEQLRFVVAKSGFWVLPPLSVVLLHPRYNLPLPAGHNCSILEHLHSQNPAFTYPRNPHVCNIQRPGQEVKKAALCYKILCYGNQSSCSVLKQSAAAAVAIISTCHSITGISYLPAKAAVKRSRACNFHSHAYLLFHGAKLWVEGLEVVSEAALSVHSGLEVSQRHLTQPVRAHCQS